MSDERNDDTKVKEHKMIQHIIAGEFLESLYTVRYIAYSFPINKVCFTKRSDERFMRYAHISKLVVHFQFLFLIINLTNVTKCSHHLSQLETMPFDLHVLKKILFCFSF